MLMILLSSVSIILFFVLFLSSPDIAQGRITLPVLEANPRFNNITFKYILVCVLIVDFQKFGGGRINPVFEGKVIQRGI